MILRALTRKLRSPKRLLSLAIEPLEQKQMLSGTAPTVANVAVGSTAWASGFVSYLQSHGLGNGGYSIPVGSSAQTLALPWNNLNQIQIKFSKDVKVEKSDLSVTGANVSQYDFANFSYDSATFTATWTLSQNIGADKVLLTLSGANLDPVVDSNGNILDGEWVDGSSTQSGNGTAGGDFAFRFNVLPGDVNQSTLVTTMDYANVAVLLNTNTSSPTYNPLRDVDGSGTINSTDQSLVSGKIGAALPTNNPSSNHAPTAQGVVNVEVNEDAADQAISLWDNFQDPTDSDSQLTYTVISNSNSSLVTSTSIDSTHGNLNLSFAANANGNADIVVRATDTGGLHVDSTVHVHVTPVDDASRSYMISTPTPLAPPGSKRPMPAERFPTRPRILSASLENDWKPSACPRV
ncbi:MAG: hypothetical protein K8T25_06645 [Planctomycetia bacterium]|nr:hypothetical protein [Planctomycetia bacterium]